MLQKYYQNFTGVLSNFFGTVENNAIYYLYTYIESSPYRPSMYVPAEYATYLGLFFNTNVIVPEKISLLTPLQQASFYQILGRYGQSSDLLTTNEADSYERAYLSVVQKTITLGAQAIIDKELSIFLNGSALVFPGENETVFYAQLGCKLLSFYSNYSLDREKFSSIANILQNLLSSSNDAFFYSYFSTLLQRYTSVFLYTQGDIHAARSALQEAIERIDGVTTNNGSYQEFLMKELKRRVLIRLYSISEFDTGLLQKLVEIDPYSEEIGLLVIQNPHTTLQEKLINYQKGVTMKPLMIQALQPYIDDVDLHELLELEKAFLLSLYGKHDQAESCVHSLAEDGSLGGSQLLGTIFDKNTHLNLREQMFQSFLTGERTESRTKGYFHSNPIFAINAGKNEVSSKFQSNYLQRNVAFGFHKEVLQFLHRGNTEIHPLTNTLCKKLKNETAHLCDYHRILISLGLHIQVLNDLSVDDLISSIDICNNIEELSVYGYLFTRLKPNRDGVPFDEIFDKKVLQFDDSQDNVRLKMVSVIRLIVNNAKDSKVIDEVEELVKIGDKLLVMLDQSSYITNFEKSLIKSRYYRAKAFLYQLKKEGDTMLQCMKTCEKYADECSKMADNSTLQKHQAIDNYIGCYESMSRTYFLLQDEENGLAYMKKVPMIDSFEAKGWVQLGEVLYKLGNYKDAKWCFANAVSLGPPLYAKSRYLLGETYKQLGMDEYEYFCISKTLEIHTLDKELNNTMFEEAKSKGDYVLENYLSGLETLKS